MRHLAGNNDQALKVDSTYRGSGGPTIKDHGLVVHDASNGTLKLYGVETPPAIQPQYSGFPYLGGMISGERIFAQRYGYWEVRMRIVTCSVGHHLAIWLLAQDGSYPPEIDMLEVIGSNPGNPSEAGEFFFNSHGPGQPGLTRVTPPNGTFAWYTLGFLWTPQDMRWFLDGNEVRRVPNFITDNDLYFLISPEIGSNWPGPTDGTTVWPMEIEIDYVRVYQLPQA
ncbi:MAG: glycoside hydrolase family 16 protein [Geminicoccaceae bacterium]